MQILFEKSHPKDLVEALKLIHQLEIGLGYSLIYYDKTVDDARLKEPVLFMFDYSKKGLDISTENYLESGFRVFALKTKRGEKIDMFELSLTVLSLWPKVLEIVKNDNQPFVYTYKKLGNKLSRIKN